MNKPMKKEPIYNLRKEVLQRLAEIIHDEHWKLSHEIIDQPLTVALSKRKRVSKFITFYLKDDIKKEMRFDQFITLRNKFKRKLKATDEEINTRNYQNYVMFSVVKMTEDFMDKFDELLGYPFDIGKKDWTEKELRVVAGVIGKEL